MSDGAQSRSGGGGSRSHVLVGFAIGALVAVLVAVVLASGDEEADDGRPTRSAAGVDEVELESFDGTPVTLSALPEGPLVINFFASWCGPCAREMPDFEAVHREVGDDVVFLGVNIQDQPAAALDLVERTGVTYQVVRDREAALFRAFGGVSMPTTVFVSAAGEVLEVRSGELSAGALRDRVARLLEADA